MRIHNWPIKALIIVAAAAAVLVAAVACGEDPDPSIYVSNVPIYKRIMPYYPCPNDINDYRGLDHKPALVDSERLPYAKKVLKEHIHPILNQEGGPIWHSTSPYWVRDWSSTAEHDEWENTVIIEIEYYVSDVELAQFPEKHRVPHCIKGVPVHIITNQPWIEATIDI